MIKNDERHDEECITCVKCQEYRVAKAYVMGVIAWRLLSMQSLLVLGVELSRHVDDRGLVKAKEA